MRGNQLLNRCQAPPFAEPVTCEYLRVPLQKLSPEVKRPPAKGRNKVLR